jgi:hypothetical protein
MNLFRLILAALGAFAAYFALGGLIFGLFPSLKEEFLKYPRVYRSEEGQMSHMPAGMAGMFLAILLLAILYASLYQGSSGMLSSMVKGACFGALVGLFTVGSHVMQQYVNLNIGLKLTLISAVAYFVEWTVAGIAIGLTYRPLMPH